jgi:nicotinamidase-related amidase
MDDVGSSRSEISLELLNEAAGAVELAREESAQNRAWLHRPIRRTVRSGLRVFRPDQHSVIRTLDQLEEGENMIPRAYEPLTADNTALVLVDQQVGLMTGVRDISTGELKHNVVALAKAAKALRLPIVLTTTASESMWGPAFPELVEALPGIEIIDRSAVNAYDDPRVSKAIESTRRKKLIFAGISLEVCAGFPAMTAVTLGFDAYVAVDASGTFSDTKREANLMRLQQAGVILSDYATMMVEILKDNGRPEAGDVYAALDMPWATLVGQIANALRK